MMVSITGASKFVNRMFEACGTYQWAREFLKNSLEAGASKVEFGIEWQAVKTREIYRRTIADNGCGMDSAELLRFFSTLGEGAKKIGGIHDNFGVGAKIAALPWNPEGLVVISYKSGIGSMIWMVLDEDSGDYELVDFEVEGKRRCVIEPQQVEDIDWSKVKPEWLTDHGTVVVLLGTSTFPNTVLGNPREGEQDIKGLSMYLNTRFWDLSHVEVVVAEMRSAKRSQWPQSREDREDTRRPNNRRILGAKHYLTELKGDGGSLLKSGTVLLDEEHVEAEWFLWEGSRPDVHTYAKQNGYIALRYKGELFQVTSGKVQFRWFGIIESKVQQNATIILDAQLYEPNGTGRWGIHPDQSRNRLIFTGNGEKGVEPPLSDWGCEFAQNLPEPIREAIRRARGEGGGSIEDNNYRKRLQDKFGNRWKIKQFVSSHDGPSPDTEVATAASSDTDIDVFQTHTPAGAKTARRSRTVKVVQRKGAVVGQGNESAVEVDVPVDIPNFRFGHKEDFEQPWHLAVWNPRDPEGPTVLINVDSPILQEVIEYHQAQFPDIYAEEVANTVRQVFGEVAACKIAHSQKLVRDITEEELDKTYRNEQALTVGLMGLLAEESVISQRLAKFGRKIMAATA